MIKYSEVSEKLKQQAEAVCEYLLPNGRMKGNSFCAGNAHGDEGDSLKVTLNGQFRGKWHDFNPGVGGDLLDLWAESHSIEMKEAYIESLSWLGIEIPKFESVKKVYNKPQAPISENKDSKVLEYLKSRSITEMTAKKYGATGVGNTLIFQYFRDGELVNRKALPINRDSKGKKLPARFEKGCELCLYGWDSLQGSERTITICEGEIDAMSLSELGISALSIPNGASGTTWIENDFDRLSKFDKIYICFDTDEAGQKGALTHAKRLGIERCYNVILPKKDANDCLVSGISGDDIKVCFDESTSFDPEQLQDPGSFKDQLMDLLYPQDLEQLGYDSPWSTFNSKIFFDKSGLSVWTGINGHGKTQFLNHMACHWMNAGARVCIASLELDPCETMQNLVSPLSCMNTNPRIDNIISKDFALACVDWMKDSRLWFYDEFGGTTASSLLKVMEYAHRKYSIDVFVIDSLSLISIDDDDYNSQATFVRELVSFKKRNDCHVHLVVHPRKGADENSPPGKFDFKGSGTITNLADNCFSVSRNKMKEMAYNKQESGVQLDETEIRKLDEPDCYVWCMKQRKGGHEGKFGFWLNHTAKQYLSSESQRPVPYIKFQKGDK